MRTVALGPIRHACHSCGTCCTGWRVKVAPSEQERIARHAAALGVADPVVEDKLRQVDGCCVFLGQDRLCQIHARFGEAEKPGICQVFPRVAIATETALRLGADPGCSSTWRTFVDGPLIEFPIARSPLEHLLSPELAATELQLITLALHPHMTVAHLIGIVCGDQGHAPELPPGLLPRLLARMKGLDFFITHPEAGPHLVADLAATAVFLRDVDPQAPPSLTLSEAISRLTLEVLARTLFLRLSDSALAPMGQLIVVLAGAIACAYADPRIERFGPAIAAWSRLSRLEGFWVPFIPDVATARFILTGLAE